MAISWNGDLVFVSVAPALGPNAECSAHALIKPQAWEQMTGLFTTLGNKRYWKVLIHTVITDLIACNWSHFGRAQGQLVCVWLRVHKHAYLLQSHGW